MKAPAIRSYRCVCEECEPLPPIDGLSAPVVEEGRPAVGGVLKKLSLRLARVKDDSDA